MNSRSTWRFWSARLAWSAFACSALLGLVLAQGDKDAHAQKGAAPANKYIGADKCKLCHLSESAGNPFGAWQRTDHSKAFEKLASDAAKKTAKEQGVDDPQKSDKCLKCHTTAFDAPTEMIKKGFDPKLGVQCETCHGPGDLHMKARLAAASEEAGDEGSGGKGKAAQLPKIPAGEILVNIDQSTCLKCHNEASPNFKPFCFYESRAKIQHFDPRKPRTKEETLVCGCEKCTCKHGCEPGSCGVEPKAKQK